MVDIFLGDNKLQLSREVIEVILDLLLPEGTNRDKAVNFTMKKIIRAVFALKDPNKEHATSPEHLLEAFNSFRALEEGNYERFIKDFLSKLTIETSEPNPFIEGLKPSIPALKIISNLAMEKRDIQVMRKESLRWFDLLYYYIETEENEDLKQNLAHFIKFLSVLTIQSGQNVEYDITTQKILEPKDTFKIMTNFCNLIGLSSQKYEELSEHKNLVPNMSFLIMSLLNQDVYNIPTKVITDIQGMYPDIKGSKFIPFSLKFSDAILYQPDRQREALDMCLSSHSFEADLQDFIKIISFYTLENFDKFFTKSISVMDNPYFKKICQSSKIDSRELLGLLELICQKKDNLEINIMLKAILVRMDLDKEKCEMIRSLLDLLLSKDDVLLLRAFKIFNLDLKYAQFLLVGRGILNPKFISAELFEDAGVTDQKLIADKNTIFNSTPENFRFWKSQIRGQITRTLNDLKAEAQHYEKFIAKAELVKEYLGDWDNASYTKLRITSLIKALDNKENQLQKKILSKENGSAFDYADFLVIITGTRRLQVLEADKWTKFEKEQEDVIRQLANYLSINPETLKHILNLFLVTDYTVVTDSFFRFFPDEKKNSDGISKTLCYFFRRLGILQNRNSFIQNELSDSIKLPNNQNKDVNFKLPPAVFKKILSSETKVNLNIGDFLEVADLVISKLDLTEDSRDDVIRVAYNLSLFAKGLLPMDLISQFASPDRLTKPDDRVLGFFKILCEPHRSKKLELMSDLFKRDKDPIKAYLAFYGLFSGYKYTVKNLHQRRQGGVQSESIKSYLGRLCEVYPETFDLFDVMFERDVSKFLKQMNRIIQVINQNAFVDMNFIENLFALAQADHYNTNYLSTQLNVSSDILEFFMHLQRVTMKKSRTKEFENISKSSAMKKVLSKLKIKQEEFVALLRLIFGKFESSESIEQIFKSLHLQKKSAHTNQVKNEFDIDLFQGLLAIKEPIDEKAQILQKKDDLANFKKKTKGLFTTLGLARYEDYTHLIFRLSVGDFLVLKENKDMLKWAFPSENYRSVNAAMALCGLINFNLRVSPDINEEVNQFITARCPKYDSLFLEKDDPQHENDDFKSDAKLGTKPSAKSNAKPGTKSDTKTDTKTEYDITAQDSISYATYLAFRSIKLIPEWTEMFLLDKTTFKLIHTDLPDLSYEFMLSLVLQFIHMPDTFGDVFGLLEWTKQCINHPEVKGRLLEDCEAKRFYISRLRVDLAFVEKFTFSYDRVKEIANTSGLSQDKQWKKYFEDKEEFNKKINRSFVYLLTIKMNTDRQKKATGDKLRQYIKNDPPEFLKQVAELLYKEEEEEPLRKSNIREARYERDSELVGKLIKKAVKRIYDLIGHRFVKRHELENDPSLRTKDKLTSPLTNLSILRAIVLLRTSLQNSIPYDRKLYNINQLVANVERKMFFADVEKLPKFFMIKLLGISVGQQINNITQWSLPLSLFTRVDYRNGINRVNYLVHLLSF